MKIFIDCGYYSGRALDYYAPMMDDTWRVFVFEPNTDIDVDESVKRFPFKVEWLKKAVWTSDGNMEFVIGGRDDASHLAALHTGEFSTVSVPSVDFSKFIDELPKDATIVISMDIEGAEFPALRKMIKDGTSQRISLLDIEFHHRLVLDEDASTASLLRMELESQGVMVKLKLEM